MQDLYDASAWKRAEAYIYDIPKFTKKNTLANTEKLLEKLGNPGVNKKIIHVAGTNGKGSVCNYLNALLQTDGYRVGMFTSPHLITMNERIRINNDIISKKRFLKAFYELKQFLEETESAECSHPTFFEFLFLLAMKVFEEEKVDVIILETGLGGRLDATNVIGKPWLTIITEIGLDHMQYLGDTKALIAEEKAGIIKENVPVVVLNKSQDATEVIVRKAKKAGAPCYLVEKEDGKFLKLRNKSIDFSYKSSYYDYITFSLSTLALYQVENAALALKAYEILKAGEWNLPLIKEALFQADWEGRMEEVLPNVYVDGAHNADGIKAFLETVEHMPKEGKRTLLFSVVDDKAYEEMVDTIVSSALFDCFTVIHMPEERCVTMEKLEEIFAKYPSIDVSFAEGIEEGLKGSVLKREENESVYIAGSLYLVGFVKDALGRTPKDD